MGYIGAGISRFNTADELTVTGDAQIDTTTLVVDSTNNRVGIGTASPAKPLTVVGGDFSTVLLDNSNAAHGTQILFQANGATNSGADIQMSDAGGMKIRTLAVEPLSFHTSASAGSPSERMNIQSDGKVGINCTPDATFKVVSSGANLIIGFNGTQNYFDASENIFRNFAGSERMRLDSSGNLLVGNSTFGAEDGVYISQGGNYVWARSDDTSGYFDRTGSDGRILEFRKDGTTVGSIGVDGGDNLFITGQTGNTGGLYFNDAAISPAYQGVERDAYYDLGKSPARFQNGWFSNVVYSHYLRGHNDTDTGIDIGDNGSTANIITVITGGSERARFVSTEFLVGMTTANGLGGKSDVNGVEVGPGYININRDDTATVNAITFGKNNSVVGSISTTGSSTAFNTSSDRRLKSNIEDAASASDKIDAIQVRQFDWNVDDSHQDYGLIAQELQPIEPLAVTGDADSDKMMAVDYSKLVPMLIKEIQELRSRVAALEE